MSFKDLSQGNENVVTSTLSGDIELRSPKNISLYPGSNDPGGTLGGDKLVWIRDGAKLVFEGRVPDDWEAKLYADTLTADREIVFQDASGTLALLVDVNNALADANAYTDQQIAGASVTYTNTTPMPEALGGYDVGTTFNNVSIEDVLNGLLYPYQDPAFTSFVINGQAITVEVGSSVSAGDYTFSWSSVNNPNIQTNSIEIKDETANVVLASNLDNDGSELITLVSSVSKTNASSNVWRISALDTQNNSFSRTFSINWRWRVYHGTSSSTTLDEAGVESLVTNSLSSNFTGNKTFAAGDYKWMAYPTTMGLKTSFFDQATGFAVAMEPAYTLAITNAYGITQDYYVHRTTNAFGAITIGVS